MSPERLREGSSCGPTSESMTHTHRERERESERESEETSGNALQVGMHWFRPVSLPQCRRVNSGLEICQHYSPFSLMGKRERRECVKPDTSQSPPFVSVSAHSIQSDANTPVLTWDELRELIWSVIAFPFLFFFLSFPFYCLHFFQENLIFKGYFLIR